MADDPPHLDTDPRAALGADRLRDAALVARCRAGDPSAFRSLVAQHERAVFALVSRIAGRGPHVEDLAQETFLRAFRAIGSFDPAGPATLSTWLCTIAMRVTLDAQKRRRVPLDPIERGESVEAGTDPETERERAELGRAIARAAANLPDDQRAAFVLMELHGLSVGEIATALDTPEATVKTRLFRARERLRAALATFWKERSEP